MKITKEQFKDVDFLTSLEKYQIAKHFQTFVKNGFQRKDFNKRVYEHLHLHCSFIAHYNIDGFYYEYFNGSKTDLKRFVEHFLNLDNLPYEDVYNGGNVNYEPYSDINKTIADILLENKINKKVI
jgi:hypothetical protein